VDRRFPINALATAVNSRGVFEDDEGHVLPTDTTIAAIEAALGRGEEYPAEPVLPGTTTHFTCTTNSTCTDPVANLFLDVVDGGYVVQARYGDDLYKRYAERAAVLYALQWFSLL
jgi:hypothetical protein